MINVLLAINCKDSFKSLQMAMEKELPNILPFEEITCLFMDENQRQYYSIAFSEDIDRENTYKNLIS